jgi:RecA/RadA recombinase
MARAKKTEKTEEAPKKKKDFLVDKSQRIYFSTGHTLLDLVVGGGEAIGYGMGYPSGTICRDWGGSSATKSFKATELIAANYYKYKDKFRWRYVDPEHGNTIDSKKLYGFDMFKDGSPEHIPVKTVEDWDCDVNQFLDSLKEDEVGIYVLDSLDSLSSNELEEIKEDRRKALSKGAEYDDGTYSMGAQKLLSQQLFRGLAEKLEEKNSLLYIISQARDNTSATGYGKKDKLGGGRAIGFYETVRIYSKLVAKEEKQKRATGVIIEVNGEKVRNPRPFRSCDVSVDFNYGMDDIGDCIDFLYDLRTVDKRSLKAAAEKGELLWNKEEPNKLSKEEREAFYAENGMTRDELIKFIETNKLKKELRRKVVEKYEEIEASILTQRANKYEED